MVCSYTDHGNVMPLLRSADVLTISQHCASAQLASELRMAIEAVVHRMQPLNFIERLFGVSFCPLKKSLLKILSDPTFQLLPLLAAESQYLLCRESRQANAGARDKRAAVRVRPDVLDSDEYGNRRDPKAAQAAGGRL